MFRKTIRVFIITYLVLLIPAFVAAYFVREESIRHLGSCETAFSLPTFALAGAGVLLVYLLLFFYIFLFVWSLFDLMRSEFTHTHNKILWFIMIILFPLLGTIFYLIISPKQKMREVN